MSRAMQDLADATGRNAEARTLKECHPNADKRTSENVEVLKSRPLKLGCKTIII